jgi:hypothetical protein
MHDQQEPFAAFVRRDLARIFEMPGETPCEMLTLVDLICGLDRPNRT